MKKILLIFILISPVTIFAKDKIDCSYLINLMRSIEVNSKKFRNKKSISKDESKYFYGFSGKTITKSNFLTKSLLDSRLTNLTSGVQGFFLDVFKGIIPIKNTPFNIDLTHDVKWAIEAEDGSILLYLRYGERLMDHKRLLNGGNDFNGAIRFATVYPNWAAKHGLEIKDDGILFLNAIGRNKLRDGYKLSSTLKVDEVDDQLEDISVIEFFENLIKKNTLTLSNHNSRSSMINKSSLAVGIHTVPTEIMELYKNKISHYLDFLKWLKIQESIVTDEAELRQINTFYTHTLQNLQDIRENLPKRIAFLLEMARSKRWYLYYVGLNTFHNIGSKLYYKTKPLVLNQKDYIRPKLSDSVITELSFERRVLKKLEDLNTVFFDNPSELEVTEMIVNKYKTFTAPLDQVEVPEIGNEVQVLKVKQEILQNIIKEARKSAEALEEDQHMQRMLFVLENIGSLIEQKEKIPKVIKATLNQNEKPVKPIKKILKQQKIIEKRDGNILFGKFNKSVD